MVKSGRYIRLPVNMLRIMGVSLIRIRERISKLVGNKKQDKKNTFMCVMY